MKTLYFSAIIISGISALVISGILMFLLPVKEINTDEIPAYQYSNKSVSEQFTPQQLFEAERIAITDSKVQEIAQGRAMELMSHGFYSYPSEPRLNFNVGNKTQLVVTVDIPSRKVINVLDAGAMGQCCAGYVEVIPQPSIQNKTLAVALKLSNNTLPSNDHHLWLRFFNAKNNQTIQHVSFLLSITNQNRLLFRGLLHTHTGILKLDIFSTAGPGWTVKADREPILKAWVPKNDDEPIYIYAPLFNDSTITYHVNIKMYTIDYDSNIFSPSNVPNFDLFLNTARQNEIITATASINQSAEKPYIISNGKNRVFENNGSFTGFTINYTLSGNNRILEAIFEKSVPELSMHLKTNSSGTLNVTIPRNLLDARMNHQDVRFVVLVNGTEWHYSETRDAEKRTLTIPFYEETREIDIIGTN